MHFPKYSRPKLFSFLFAFTFFQFVTFSQDIALIVSAIGSQEMFEGARIEVNFSTFRYVDSCSFSSPNLPSFGHIENAGKGYGKFIFEPTANDTGTYDITLDASFENASSSQTFQLTVKKIPSGTAVFYCDPLNGSNDNNGDKEHPFGTLKEVVNSNFNIPAGAIFFLRNGNHGRPVFSGANSKTIHILAESGHRPMIEQISMPFTNNWNIQGIIISPEAAGETRKTTYVNIFGGSKDITIQNCEIYAKKDISAWTTNQDWYDAAGDGIISSGRNCVFKNNYIHNTWFPIQIFQSARYNVVSNNIIDYFGADAIRGLSNYSQFTYNQIKNAIVDDYSVPQTGNHDDAFQSWTGVSKYPPVIGIVIRGNQITDINDPNLPLPTSVMQGIVDFDGFVQDWIIEDNLVVQHHPHGIALYGAKNCRIANNTVVRNPLNIHSPNDHPWIRINKTKIPESYLSTGNLTRNNIMGESVQNEYPGTIDHNLISKNYADIFVDYENWDFHLKHKSNTVNAGLKEGASTIDLDYHIRTDSMPDLGCYEYLSDQLDFDSPNVFNISLSNKNTSSAHFQWETSSDDIKHYLISYADDTPTLSVNQPKMFLADLSDETDYQVKVIAVDLANHTSNPQYLNITTPEYNYLADTLYCAANDLDAEINKDQKLEWVRFSSMKVGSNIAVIPFRLPTIPLDAKIVKVELDLNIEAIEGTPQGNIDLYGLNARGTADVSVDDFWKGPFDHETAKGHSLIDNLITPSSQIGKITTDSIQSSKLTKFIIEQYNKNAEPEDYIFFRLNSDILNENSASFYQIASSNNGNALKVPLLKIYTSKPVATTNIDKEQNIIISPNPVKLQDDIHLTLANFHFNDNAQLQIWSSTGQLVYSKPFINGDTVSTKNMQKGVYIISIISQNKTWSSKLILI